MYVFLFKNTVPLELSQPITICTVSESPNNYSFYQYPCLFICIPTVESAFFWLDMQALWIVWLTLHHPQGFPFWFDINWNSMHQPLPYVGMYPSHFLTFLFSCFNILQLKKSHWDEQNASKD